MTEARVKGKIPGANQGCQKLIEEPISRGGAGNPRDVGQKGVSLGGGQDLISAQRSS